MGVPAPAPAAPAAAQAPSASPAPAGGSQGAQWPPLAPAEANQINSVFSSVRRVFSRRPNAPQVPQRNECRSAQRQISQRRHAPCAPSLQADTDNDGKLIGKEARDIMLQANIPKEARMRTSADTHPLPALIHCGPRALCPET